MHKLEPLPQWKCKDTTRKGKTKMFTGFNKER